MCRKKLAKVHKIKFNGLIHGLKHFSKGSWVYLRGKFESWAANVCFRTVMQAGATVKQMEKNSPNSSKSAARQGYVPEAQVRQSWNLHRSHKGLLFSDGSVCGVGAVTQVHPFTTLKFI